MYSKGTKDYTYFLSILLLIYFVTSYYLSKKHDNKISPVFAKNIVNIRHFAKIISCKPLVYRLIQFLKLLKSLFFIFIDRYLLNEI